MVQKAIRIVYIDADSKYRSKARRGFFSSAFQVSLFESGSEGIKFINHNDPDIVVVDCYLPDHSAEEIFTECSFPAKRQIPFVALTFNGSIDKSKLYSLGFSACLGKPFKHAALREVVEDVLVSHQLRMEEMYLWDKIRESRDFLENVVEGSLDPIVTTDEKGIITFCNRAFEEMTGKSYEELNGLRISELLIQGHSEMLKLSALLKKKKTIQNYKTAIIGENEEKIDLNVSISTMKQCDGHLMGALCIGKLRTNETFVEFESTRSDRLATIMETAVTVNHAINNPLVPILGNVQYLLQNDEADPEERKKRLKAIMKNALRIRDFTQKLARISHPVTVEYMKGTRMLDVDAST